MITLKWCNGPCGRELPASAFYDLGAQLSSFCRRCDNIRRVEAFKARYSSPRARLLYLRAQRLRRRRRQLDTIQGETREKPEAGGDRSAGDSTSVVVHPRNGRQHTERRVPPRPEVGVAA